MQRRKRHHLPEEVYVGQNHVIFITICVANRGRWLTESELAPIPRSEILKIHTDHPVIGYCIMPDHLHMLLCNAGTALGTIMNGFKGRTSRLVRKARPGLQVWQEGYWDHIIRKEEGLYKVLQYVLLNPVRAGLVSNWWNYEWLGTPLLGEVSPDLFGYVPPEDVMWRELLSGGP